MNKESFDYNNLPPEGIFYNRMSASSHSRGHRYAAENTKKLLHWLEKGKKRALQNLKDKGEKALWADNSGWKKHTY